MAARVDTSALDELLRRPLPDAVGRLDQATVDGLAVLVQTELARREDEEAVTLDRALGAIPWPVRGAVKKAVGL